MAQRTVLLVSADEWGWTDLRRVISEVPELTQVGDARTVEDALLTAAQMQPDIVISAANVHGVSTRNLLRSIQTQLGPNAVVIRFSPHLDPTDIMELEDLRLSGHLLWDELTPAQLRTCLAALFDGVVIIRSPGLIDQFLENQGIPSGGFTVSTLDRSILKALEMNASVREIAETHGMSERTVRRHVELLKDRLGAGTLFALGCAANRHGLVD